MLSKYSISRIRANIKKIEYKSIILKEKTARVNLLHLLSV